MADRQFTFDFLARDGVTSVVRKVGDAVDDLGDEMRGTGAEAQKLDREIDDVKRSLAELAVAFAATDDAAARVDLTRAMRAQQAELRKLTTAKSLLPDVDQVGGDAEVVGVSIGKRIAAGIRTAMPSAAGAIATGIAVASPLIGASIAGAVVGAAGAGGVIGGVIVASRDARVQAAAVGLGEFIGKELEKAAAPFVPAVLSVIGKAKAAFVSMNADIRGIFADSSKLLGPFADGLIGMVQRMLPGIRAAIADAGPVFDVLAKELPELGQSIGNFFREMGEHAQQGAMALKVIFDILETGVTVVGKVAGFFGDLFQGLVTGALGVVEALIWLHDAWSELWGDDSKSQPLENMRRKLTELRDGMEQTGAGFRTAGDEATFVGTKMDAARAKADGLKQSMDALTNANLSYFDAQTAAARAADQAADAIKKNGRATDENTQKGNANRQSLSSVAHAFNQVQGAAEASGQSSEAVNGIYERNRQKLIQLAQAAGYTAGEAAELANKILAIPSNRTTTFTAVDNASWVASRVNSAIAAVKRSVMISIQAGLAGAKADGGPVSKGKAYLVGEKRPEVFVPDRDGVIIPSIEQARGGGWTGGGGAVTATAPAPTYVQVTVNVPPTANIAEVGRYTAEALDAYYRNGGRRP